MSDKVSVVEHYNRHAPEMENVADFYDWVVRVFASYQLPKDVSIVDVGCGTGALLERLHRLGYSKLTGVDFATGCLELARQRVDGVELMLHDIEEGPLASRYDVVIMTTILDFLAEPSLALCHVRGSLRENGLVFVTIRNLLAYFPWYHLRSLARYMEPWPRFRHWFLYLTTPLALRRNDQPAETIYEPEAARRLFLKAGFQLVDERAAQILPMFWIPDMPRLMSVMRRLDTTIGPMLPAWLQFRYLFVCRPQCRAEP